jgi:hypothetical protein
MDRSACSRWTDARIWDNMSRIDEASLQRIESDLSRTAVSRFELDLHFLLFDCTNFFTFIDSFNDRCEMAQRGKSKEGRANLRIVGLALLVTAAPLPLCSTRRSIPRRRSARSTMNGGSWGSATTRSRPTSWTARKPSGASRPGGSRQEVAGIAIAYNLVRIEMARVAREAGLDPRRISFVHALHLIQGFCLSSWATAPGALPRRLASLERDMRLLVLPERRTERRYPRHVKIKMSNYARNHGRPSSSKKGLK